MGGRTAPGVGVLRPQVARSMPSGLSSSSDESSATADSAPSACCCCWAATAALAWSWIFSRPMTSTSPAPPPPPAPSKPADDRRLRKAATLTLRSRSAPSRSFSGERSSSTPPFGLSDTVAAAVVGVGSTADRVHSYDCERLRSPIPGLGRAPSHPPAAADGGAPAEGEIDRSVSSGVVILRAEMTRNDSAGEVGLASSAGAGGAGDVADLDEEEAIETRRALVKKDDERWLGDGRGLGRGVAWATPGAAVVAAWSSASIESDGDVGDFASRVAVVDDDARRAGAGRIAIGVGVGAGGSGAVVVVGGPVVVGDACDLP